MTEIRHTDLVLTRDETATLADRWSGGPLREDLVDALHARTEGWAAGLRLAVMTLPTGARAEEVLPAGEAGGNVLHELLITEALEQQPVDVRSFLQRTSIVPVVEPAVAEALSGRADSRDLLRRLAADHVFVTPLSDRGDHYRYHPLLADVLRLELRAAGGETAAYEAAARWYEQQGRYAEAIDHALAGGRHELAFRLIVNHLADLYADGHRAESDAGCSTCPTASPPATPTGSSSTAPRCCSSSAPSGSAGCAWPGRSSARIAPTSAPGSICSAPSRRPVVAGSTSSIPTTLRAVALDPGVAGDPFEEIVTAWSARLATLHGDDATAITAATDVYRRDRQLIRELPARSLLAATLHAAGDPAGADLAADAIAAWRANGERDYLGMADALVVGTEVALRDGDVEEAEVLAASAVGVTDLPPPHLLNVRAEIALASVYQATDRSAEAHARVRALRTTMAGFDAAPAVLALLDAAIRNGSAQPPTGPVAPVEPLTERELTILRLLTSHLTFPEIGRELFISRHTVKTHVSRIYRKLGASSRSAAITTARELGLM